MNFTADVPQKKARIGASSQNGGFRDSSSRYFFFRERVARRLHSGDIEKIGNDLGLRGDVLTYSHTTWVVLCCVVLCCVVLCCVVLCCVGLG